jgi:hypothetical protein
MPTEVASCPMEAEGCYQRSKVDDAIFASGSTPDNPALMRTILFRFLARLNKAVLPKLWDRDLARLTPLQKALVGWRYYVTRNALSGSSALPALPRAENGQVQRVGNGEDSGAPVGAGYFTF